MSTVSPAILYDKNDFDSAASGYRSPVPWPEVELLGGIKGVAKEVMPRTSAKIGRFALAATAAGTKAKERFAAFADRSRTVNAIAQVAVAAFAPGTPSQHSPERHKRDANWENFQAMLSNVNVAPQAGEHPMVQANAKGADYPQWHELPTEPLPQVPVQAREPELVH